MVYLALLLLAILGKPGQDKAPWQPVVLGDPTWRVLSPIAADSFPAFVDSGTQLTAVDPGVLALLPPRAVIGPDGRSGLKEIESRERKTGGGSWLSHCYFSSVAL